LPEEQCVKRKIECKLNASQNSPEGKLKSQRGMGVARSCQISGKNREAAPACHLARPDHAMWHGQAVALG